MDRGWAARVVVSVVATTHRLSMPGHHSKSSGRMTSLFCPVNCLLLLAVRGR
ncbi:hypothetical protein A2U01_0084280 [Trifolium medium]|uniref:Uncharacterized protein n=1 Tax=Trifolium medium TaxID=97028 RepID=A0A392TPE5_9FABA|nr:hypothetical protein [Trifolium medium]